MHKLYNNRFYIFWSKDKMIVQNEAEGNENH